MQVCKEHWQELKEALHTRELSQFIASNTTELADRLNHPGGNPPDPLITAHNMILERSMQHLGMYIFAIQDDGSHYCPLCEARKNLPPHPETLLPCDTSWIETLAEYLRNEYIKEGWLTE